MLTKMKASAELAIPESQVSSARKTFLTSRPECHFPAESQAREAFRMAAVGISQGNRALTRSARMLH